MPERIDRDEVQRLVSEGAQLVDVLPAKDFAEEHLAGAVNLPLRRIEAEATTVLDWARPVIVYCDDAA